MNDLVRRLRKLSHIAPQSPFAVVAFIFKSAERCTLYAPNSEQ